MDHKLSDELLERIWMMEERGVDDTEVIRAEFPELFRAGQFAHLVDNGLVTRKGTRVKLTSEGRELASGIIRRHRLAERLLTDVLNVTNEQIEDEACTFEHNITPGIVDSICTLLGHPRECPHGNPIPEGPCCRQARQSLDAIVTNLTSLQVGERGTIAYLNSSHFDRIKKLYAFGVFPGVEIELIQRSPAFVIQVEETQLAIERVVALDIYVRRQKEVQAPR